MEREWKKIMFFAYSWSDFVFTVALKIFDTHCKMKCKGKEKCDC